MCKSWLEQIAKQFHGIVLGKIWYYLILYFLFMKIKVMLLGPLFKSWLLIHFASLFLQSEIFNLILNEFNSIYIYEYRYPLHHNDYKHNADQAETQLFR